MIEFYINDYLVDITEDIDISLTYQMTDFSNPQAVKNSYSKTVELQGTKTNNNIFGHIFNFDKVINNNGLIGTNFNPNLRVPYTIKVDGDITDTGYLHLDEINVKDGNITYSVTLYGSLGDFFNNLMYSENDEDKNLASLYYGINRLSKEDEDKNTLFEYDLDFVDKCWKQRCNKADYDETSIYNIFCPIPTHSGLYDDFESSKILYNVKNITEEENKYIPNYINIDNKQYTRFKEYIGIETPRELEEYEIGDLRSHNQRLGMRFKTIYDAIKNPVNNGGYEVDDTNLNDYSKEYINNAYIAFNRFNYEDINETTKNEKLNLSKNPIIFDNLSGDFTQSQSFDVSNYYNPHISVNIIPYVKLNDTTITGDTICTEFCYNRKSLVGSYWAFKGSYYLSWQCYYIKYKQGNNVLKYSDVYIYTEYDDAKDSTSLEPIEVIYGYDVLLKKIFVRCPWLNNSEEHINYEYLRQARQKQMYEKNISAEVDVIGTEFVGNDLTIIEDLPKECDNIEVCAFMVDVHFESTYTKVKNKEIDNFMVTMLEVTNPMVCLFYGNKDKIEVVPYTSKGLIGDSEDNQTAIYDGSIINITKRHVFNKKTLFLNTKTPFDYLISLGKTLNWVFVPSLYEKKIYIYSKDNYYDREVIDINDYMDRSEYNILPSTIEYKQYNVNIPTPETYCTELFKEKNNRNYAQYTYNPNYQFSNESYQLLEDTVYTLALPYKMHSVYFTNQQDKIPTPCLGNKYTVFAWKTEEGDFAKGEQQFKGALLNLPMSVAETDNFTDLLCCFDAENAPVDDFDNMICLFNGAYEFKDTDKKLYLSNDFKLLEELADGNCYVINKNGTSLTSFTSNQEEEVTREIAVMPLFSTSTNNVSLQANDTVRRDLWALCFENDITQVYSVNSKILTCKVFLKEQPQKALKHFYFLDNSLWIINKINDWKPNSNDLTEVELVKILDGESFCLPNE